MTAKRFMVDDCGTLIDMTNRNTYDYVSDVCDLLNELSEENKELKKDERQLSIDFMGYKMRLIEVLQKKYDKVKGKTLYADVYTEIAEEMGVDLE